MQTALEAIHRLTEEEVYQMIEAGVLGAEDRFELIDGILLDVPRAGEPHSETVARLNEHFVRGVGPELQVRVQDTLYVPRGFVSPDLLVVTRDPGRQRLTSALLVVEVSRTSRARDEAKALDYAQAGVSEYWRVDLDAAELVVRRDPAGDAYRELRRYVPGEAVVPPLDAPRLDLATLLGSDG
jgi:Uma2 family endonuclease